MVATRRSHIRLDSANRSSTLRSLSSGQGRRCTARTSRLGPSPSPYPPGASRRIRLAVAARDGSARLGLFVADVRTGDHDCATCRDRTWQHGGVLIYKILLPGEWAEFQAAGRFDGSPFDRESGFIHCSSRAQLPGTAARVFGLRRTATTRRCRDRRLRAR
ncbi:DUF952 domain-containing protein [Micromonospora sp. LOL_024]|uniref:DUF952 domain-containing protein n=1 Tax=Micromonospora sp. LOL_024 TaxID=3345412 RepID=UPI003A8BACC6